jgi:hypothetical protein
MQRNPLVILAVMLVIFSLACQSVPFLAHPTPTPTTTPTPTQTPTPTGVPGITMPVTVNNVKLIVTQASFANHYLFGTDDYTPKSSADQFLIVFVKIQSDGTSQDDISKWGMKVNNSIDWAFLKSQGPLWSIESIEWVFIVPTSSPSFTLNFPGGIDVPLDSLL